jgi:hypothetical protein
MATKITNIKESLKIKDNKDILFDVLDSCGVTNVEVSFSGGGDDGQIDSITYYPEKNKSVKAKLKKNEIVEGTKVSDGIVWDPKTKTSTQTYRSSVTIQELIDDICYQVLEEHFGGWENNEGGCGIFYFDVQKRRVDLELNENFIETRKSKYRF